MSADEIVDRLANIQKVLEEIWRIDVQRFPSPIGPKPRVTIWNYGKFILNRVLPAGQWTTIWEKESPETPMNVYWKVVVCDTPLFDCLCFQDDSPICDTGCNLNSLFTLGITNYNDRGWVHLYDTVNSRYGLQCNILRPIKGTYKYRIYNNDTVNRNCTVCYVKWYKWAREEYDIQYGPYGRELAR